MHMCPMVTPGVPPIPHVGGPITGPGCPTVLIGALPAARVSDMAVCVGPPDTIALGSTTVLIGGMPAARMGDTCTHGGNIITGWPTVLIGGAAGNGGWNSGSGDIEHTRQGGGKVEAALIDIERLLGILASTTLAVTGDLLGDSLAEGIVKTIEMTTGTKMPLLNFISKLIPVSAADILRSTPLASIKKMLSPGMTKNTWKYINIGKKNILDLTPGRYLNSTAMKIGIIKNTAGKLPFGAAISAVVEMGEVGYKSFTSVEPISTTDISIKLAKAGVKGAIKGAVSTVIISSFTAAGAFAGGFGAPVGFAAGVAVSTATENYVLEWGFNKIGL